MQQNQWRWCWSKKVKFIDFIIVALSKEKAPEQGRECINLKTMVATPPLVEPCNACNEAKYEVIFKGWILHHPRCWPETRRRSVGEVFAAVDEPNANSLLPSGSTSYLPMTVFIQNINDNPSIFQSQGYNVKIDKNTPPGLTIYREIQAPDFDKPNSTNSDVRYSIVSGNENRKLIQQQALRSP